MESITVSISRKLAYVAKVIQIVPIHNADSIELAVINGWRCVVKKDEFQVNELAIYFSIDSVPDFEDQNFAFLKNKNVSRIKTIKLRGVISQGLLGPLSWLSERGHTVDNLAEGDDVTELMGVTKFQTAEEAVDNPSIHPIFPTHLVPKTDSTRLQSDPERYFTSILNREIIITRKEDGCSCSVIFYNGDFIPCGRNVVLTDISDRNFKHYYRVIERYNLQQVLTSIGRNLAIQGEVIGSKVNGNRLRLDELTFRVFDMYDIDTQSYLLFDEIFEICTTNGIPMVPLIFRGLANDLELSVDSFLNMADKQEYLKGVTAEGIVVKTNDQPHIPRVSFKVISNKYLLKHDL
eukprot:gene14391-19316_t